MTLHSCACICHMHTCAYVFLSLLPSLLHLSLLSSSLCFFPLSFLSKLYSAPKVWLMENLLRSWHSNLGLNFIQFDPSPRSIPFETLNSTWEKGYFNNLKETCKQMVPILVTLKTSNLKRSLVFEAAASVGHCTMTVK